MARSLKKGPVVDHHLQAKVDRATAVKRRGWKNYHCRHSGAWTGAAGKASVIAGLRSTGTGGTCHPPSAKFRCLFPAYDGYGTSETTYIQGRIINTQRDNFWLLTGNKQTADAQAMINSQGKPISWVRETLNRFCTTQYNYLVLDTAPSLGGIQERVLWASDLVIVPTPAEALGSEGLRQVLETMKRLASEKGWKGGLFGVLPTFHMEHVKEHHLNLDALRSTLGDLVLPPIHRAIVLAECPAFGQTIFEHAPGSRAAQEYSRLVDIILKA